MDISLINYINPLKQLVQQECIFGNHARHNCLSVFTDRQDNARDHAVSNTCQFPNFQRPIHFFKNPEKLL